MIKSTLHKLIIFNPRDSFHNKTNLKFLSFKNKTRTIVFIHNELPTNLQTTGISSPGKRWLLWKTDTMALYTIEDQPFPSHAFARFHPKNFQEFPNPKLTTLIISHTIFFFKKNCWSSWFFCGHYTAQTEGKDHQSQSPARLLNYQVKPCTVTSPNTQVEAKRIHQAPDPSNITFHAIYIQSMWNTW